ncbi:MAG: YebC/PmpR family DNA-binding transcriptional regulator [Patescibacteria group bacterium]|nr:YebC/PmpR family DNA-binding transcriptional regulator [Patescibacteria group bacterium]
MSGHSKWHSIKHQKAAADAKKGAVFTRVSRNITIAAKEGGGSADTNFKLATAIEQARAANMPKDNIQRAIDRGIGKGDEAALTEALYEGYGPAGIAFIIKVVTDNTNRAVSNLRHAFDKHGGTLGKSGSVMWNFEFKDGGYAPKSTIALDEQARKKFEAFIGALEELEDVNDFYSNEV